MNETTFMRYACAWTLGFSTVEWAEHGGRGWLAAALWAIYFRIVFA